MSSFGGASQRSPTITVSFQSPPNRYHHPDRQEEQRDHQDRQQKQQQQQQLQHYDGDNADRDIGGRIHNHLHLDPTSIGRAGSTSGRHLSSSAMLSSSGDGATVSENGTSVSHSSGRGSGSEESNRSVSLASARSAFTSPPISRKLDQGSTGTAEGEGKGDSNKEEATETPSSIGRHGTVVQMSSRSRAGGNGGSNDGGSEGPYQTRNRASHNLSSDLRAASLSSSSASSHNHHHHLVATPTATSMMLAPTSQTLSESLTNLSAHTATALEDVWDEVGYSPDERAAQLSDLLGKFRKLCDDKIAEERGVAVTFRNEIATARAEIVRLAKALRVEVDPALLADDDDSAATNTASSGEGESMNDKLSHHLQPRKNRQRRRQQQTLTDELAALEIALEEFRSSADVAIADLTECRDKLMDRHAALGTELEEEWRDVATDLTDDQRARFREQLREMDRAVGLRRDTIVALLKDCQHLIRELRVDPAESSLDRKIMGSLTRNAESDVIVLTSLNEAEDCTGISSRALAALTERVAELNGEKRRRKARLGEMGAEIATLWEKLHVPEPEQRAFAESVKGLGMDTIRKGENELRRLLDLKAAMMGRLIDEAREEIARLWEETSATPSQREGFQAFAITDERCYTDELLSEHDEYIQFLHRRYEQMQPILKVIEKREEILKERMEYEELQKDPSRLQQRGSALTKQLMREEKIARRIKKDLPKATDYLERKLREWKKTNEEGFLYHGEVYLDVMRRQEVEWNQYKDKVKLKKRQEKREASSREPSSTAWKTRGNPLTDAGNRSNRATRSRSQGRKG